MQAFCSSAGASGHRDQLQGHVHPELVHQWHLWEDCEWDIFLGSLHQEAYCHLKRDSDSSQACLAWRIGQACRLWRHKGRHQVHLISELASQNTTPGDLNHHQIEKHDKCTKTHEEESCTACTETACTTNTLRWSAATVWTPCKVHHFSCLVKRFAIISCIIKISNAKISSHLYLYGLVMLAI